MESIVIFANENLSLQNLFAVAGFYRRTFPSRLYAGSFRHAMRAAPLQREAFTANVVTLVLLYCKQFCFRTSRPLLRPLLALALLAAPHTFRLLPLPRYACHLPPGGRLLWAEKQRIICFSRGVVQRNKAHVMRLVSVLCHAVFGLGGGYTMRLSIKKRMRVLRGKIRCKNGRM